MGGRQKRLLEGIGGDDNTLDASEINAAINEALQTLRRQGESTDRFMAAVVNNFSNLATTINANIQRAQDMTNKRIDELERTQKRINRQVEYNIQGIRRVAMH